MLAMGSLPPPTPQRASRTAGCSRHGACCAAPGTRMDVHTCTHTCILVEYSHASVNPRLLVNPRLGQHRAGPAPVVMAEVPVERCVTAACALDDAMVGPWLADMLRDGLVDDTSVVILYILLQRSVYVYVHIFTYSSACTTHQPVLCCLSCAAASCLHSCHCCNYSTYRCLGAASSLQPWLAALPTSIPTPLHWRCAHSRTLSEVTCIDATVYSQQQLKALQGTTLHQATTYAPVREAFAATTWSSICLIHQVIHDALPNSTSQGHAAATGAAVGVPAACPVPPEQGHGAACTTFTGRFPLGPFRVLVRLCIHDVMHLFLVPLDIASV